MRRTRIRRRRSYRRVVYLALVLLVAVSGGLWALYARSKEGGPDTAAVMMRAAGVKNILVMGIDPRTDDPGRSDALFVATVNTEAKQAKLLSIPRDTRVAIEGKGYDKINHAFAFGGEPLAQKTVEGLLGAPVDHYMIFDLQAFAWTIDALGGLELEVEKRMYYEDPWDEGEGLVIDLEPGLQHLNGAQAMGYVRYRDAEGDIGRIRRQQKFLQALLKKIASPETLARLPEIVGEMRKFLQTNMSLRDMIDMTAMVTALRENGVETTLLPGRPGWWSDTSYWLPDIEATRSFMAKAMGITPTEEMKAASAKVAGRYQASLPEGLVDVEGTLMAAAEVEQMRPLQPSEVRVKIFNCSGINGAGAAVGKLLESNGFVVVSVGNGETSDREETTIAAPERGVNLFYGMPFPCLIMVSEEKNEVVVKIGRDFEL